MELIHNYFRLPLHLTKPIQYAGKDSEKINIKNTLDYTRQSYVDSKCHCGNLLAFEAQFFDKGLITKQKKMIFKGWPVDHTGDRGKWAYSGTTD